MHASAHEIGFGVNEGDSLYASSIHQQTVNLKQDRCWDQPDFTG